MPCTHQDRRYQELNVVPESLYDVHPSLPYNTCSFSSIPTLMTAPFCQRPQGPLQRPFLPQHESDPRSQPLKLLSSCPSSMTCYYLSLRPHHPPMTTASASQPYTVLPPICHLTTMELSFKSPSQRIPLCKMLQRFLPPVTLSTLLPMPSLCFRIASYGSHLEGQTTSRPDSGIDISTKPSLPQSYP